MLATNVVEQGTVHQIVQAIKFLGMPDESPSTSKLFFGLSWYLTKIISDTNQMDILGEEAHWKFLSEINRCGSIVVAAWKKTYLLLSFQGEEDELGYLIFFLFGFS